MLMTEARVNRKLAAVLAADVVGYSRLMGADEVGTLAALKRHREIVFDPAIAAHSGRIVKLMGDGTLAEFGSVVDAVNCALVIQRTSMPASDEKAFKPARLSCFESASIWAMSLSRTTTSTAMA
jgi:adenylate cyclase